MMVILTFISLYLHILTNVLTKYKAVQANSILENILIFFGLVVFI